MIVSGGTPKQESNRMEELASELDQVTDLAFVEQFKESLKMGIPTIKANLEAWHNLDYHLVGSRGYVYQSGRLLKVIEQLEGVVNLKEGIGTFELVNDHGGHRLPRTYDFRKSVIRHLLKIGV